MNRLLATFEALLQASNELELDAPVDDMLANIVANGLVIPVENEILAYWFGRYLSRC